MVSALEDSLPMGTCSPESTYVEPLRGPETTSSRGFTHILVRFFVYYIIDLKFGNCILVH